MTVMRAKLEVVNVDDQYEGQENISFRAVCADEYGEDGLDENNTYAKFTPMADLEMMICNENLFGQIKTGDVFYVDFTRAEAFDPYRQGIYDIMFERNLSYKDAKNIMDGKEISV